jgi:hypothetical protein
MPKPRSVQTKLKPSQSDTSWKTIGRTKKREQTSDDPYDSTFKKTDSKDTPPRDAFTKTLQPDPRNIPIPSSPSSSMEDSSLEERRLLSTIKGSLNKAPKSASLLPLTERSQVKPEFPTSPNTSPIFSNNEISTAEQEIIAAINAINSSKKFASISEKDSSTTCPNIEIKTPSVEPTVPDMVMSDVHYKPAENHNNKLSLFVASFPKNYSSDWKNSLANNYVKPNTTNMDNVDAALFSENERRSALCLVPFSKEFFIATGQSKLQMSEEYQELIRVMVWRNRSRIKQGLPAFTPEELETFLNEEMAQDFDDLDIYIDVFLGDLIKIRNDEQKSFDVYNEFMTNGNKMEFYSYQKISRIRGIDTC